MFFSPKWSWRSLVSNKVSHYGIWSNFQKFDFFGDVIWRHMTSPVKNFFSSKFAQHHFRKSHQVWATTEMPFSGYYHECPGAGHIDPPVEYGQSRKGNTILLQRQFHLILIKMIFVVQCQCQCTKLSTPPNSHAMMPLTKESTDKHKNSHPVWND